MPTTAAAYVSDLIFRTKLTSTAQALGVPLAVIAALDAWRARLQSTSDALLIVDLNAGGDPLEAVRLAAARPDAPHVVAYLSHVQTELAAEARSAGATQVLARSAFVQLLPSLLEALRDGDNAGGRSGSDS